jgi:hypothetical protein
MEFGEIPFCWKGEAWLLVSTASQRNYYCCLALRVKVLMTISMPVLATLPMCGFVWGSKAKVKR